MDQKQQSFSEFVKRIPFANRVIFLIFVTVWALNIPGIFQTYLVTTISTLYPNFQIWRIFTASFCNQSLLQLIIVCINFYTFAPKLQQRTSSIYILSNFFLMGSLIQFLFAIIIMFLPQSLLLSFPAGGISGVWFYFIFKYCYFNGKTKIKLCCFDFRISKIVYVFVLFAVWTLFSFGILVDAIVGIGLGYLECRFFKGSFISCNSDLCLGFLSKFDCWVSAGSNQTDNSPFQDLQQLTAIPKWSDSTKQDYFGNKKGVRLSDV